MARIKSTWVAVRYRDRITSTFHLKPSTDWDIFNQKEIDTLRADANTYGNIALQVRQGLTLCLFSYPTENPHQPFNSE